MAFYVGDGDTNSSNKSVPQYTQATLTTLLNKITAVLSEW
jgi:hypothetical protein